MITIASILRTNPIPRPRKRRLSRPISSLWLALPLVLLVATRGDTRDTSTYIDIFRSTTEFPLNPLDYYAENGVEWGFGLLSWTLSSIGLGPTSLFLVVSAATFFFVARTAQRLGMGFYEVMPFYLGTFFLSQQLMQIRQGLGVSFAFWVLVGLATSSDRRWRLAFSAAIAPMLHVVSLVPLVAAVILRPLLPQPHRWRIAIWTLALIIGCTLLARAIGTLQVFESFERLSAYAADDEYGSARNLFDPANVRAVLLLVLLLAACMAKPLARSRAYIMLLGLYALHVGIRVGFLDFQILSGRLSTAVGFAEVFLLPMAVCICVKARALRALIGIAYLIVHATATLTIQTPSLIDDYFTPLHANHAAH